MKSSYKPDKVNSSIFVIVKKFRPDQLKFAIFNVKNGLKAVTQ